MLLDENPVFKDLLKPHRFYFHSQWSCLVASLSPKNWSSPWFGVGCLATQVKLYRLCDTMSNCLLTFGTIASALSMLSLDNQNQKTLCRIRRLFLSLHELAICRNCILILGCATYFLFKSWVFECHSIEVALLFTWRCTFSFEFCMQSAVKSALFQISTTNWHSP